MSGLLSLCPPPLARGAASGCPPARAVRYYSASGFVISFILSSSPRIRNRISRPGSQEKSGAETRPSRRASASVAFISRVGKFLCQTALLSVHALPLPSTRCSETFARALRRTKLYLNILCLHPWQQQKKLGRTKCGLFKCGIQSTFVRICNLRFLDRSDVSSARITHAGCLFGIQVHTQASAICTRAPKEFSRTYKICRISS